MGAILHTYYIRAHTPTVGLRLFTISRYCYIASSWTDASNFTFHGEDAQLLQSIRAARSSLDAASQMLLLGFLYAATLQPIIGLSPSKLVDAGVGE